VLIGASKGWFSYDPATGLVASAHDLPGGGVRH
jgi:hypothetical protein